MKYLLLIFWGFIILNAQEIIDAQKTNLNAKQELLIENYYKQLAEIEKNQESNSALLQIIGEEKLKKLNSHDIKRLATCLAFCDWNKNNSDLILEIDNFVEMLIKKRARQRLKIANLKKNKINKKAYREIKR